MNRREYLIGGIGLASATTIGSIAFTTASVSRSVTSNIAADSSAIIGLTAGSVAAVTEDGSGQLVIDTAVGSASGLNSDGSFTYGDTANPATTFAFSVTNNDGNPHDLTVGISGMILPGSATFTISLYESDGTLIGDATPSTDVTHTGWAAAETIYAVITIDTSGTTSADSISGTIDFSA